jgi:mono/diheme cytochrome c family protein
MTWHNLTTLTVSLALLCAVGCQQKMADQPAQRPYEQSTMFPNNQVVRPLEKGVIHRNQALPNDPIVTWLTPAGKAPKVDPKWKDMVDPTGNSAPPMGAPTDVENFVKEFPFDVNTEEDLKRGQTLFAANCALCHGAAGYGNGKIVERGVLRPPSYHVDPTGKTKDWSTLGPDGTPRYTGLEAGYSRGFFRYGKRVSLKEVPVGYIYQVLTWGYGGMASHDVQIADPADRWRVVAYIRTLQNSQLMPEADVPASIKEALNKPKADANKTGGHK